MNKGMGGWLNGYLDACLGGWVDRWVTEGLDG